MRWRIERGGIYIVYVYIILIFIHISITRLLNVTINENVIQINLVRTEFGQYSLKSLQSDWTISNRTQTEPPNVRQPAPIGVKLQQ